MSEKVDLETQQKLIDKTWEPKTLKANVEAYNKSYDNLWDNFGLGKVEFGRYERSPRILRDYFKTLDYDFLAGMKPSPVAFRTEDVALMDRKMNRAAELIEELEESFKVKANLTEAERNLVLVKRDKIKLKLKEWLFRVQDGDDDRKTMSGLPFDQNMMMQVFQDIKTERNRDWLELTSEQKDARMLEIVQEVWDTIYDKVIVHTQPDRTKKEFDDFRKVFFDVFQPEDIYHYRLKDVSKIMFLQSFWAGGEKKVFEIDEQAKKMITAYNDTPADHLEIWKEALRFNPNVKMTGELGLFVKALDTKFIPTLLNKVRLEFTGAYFVRCAQQVLTKVHQDDYEIRKLSLNMEMTDLGDVKEQKAGLREQLMEYGDKVDQVIFRQDVITKELAKLKEENEKTLDMPLPDIEEMFHTLVKEEFWVGENDPRADKVAKFSEKLLANVKSGKGDIVALEAEAKALLPTDLVSDKNPIDDREYARVFVTYVRGKRRRMDLWSLQEVLWAETGKTDAGFKKKRNAAMLFLDRDFDDIMLRTVKHLIEEGTMKDLVKICEDYSKIVKVFKGEVYGTITSAKKLSKSETETIIGALSKQNPGKKFFLTEEVDPNLLAGFIVKCGGDKLDYSLQRQTVALQKRLRQ
eukprot:UN24848